MLAEGLVIFSCTIGHCQEAMDSYNHYYPEPYQSVMSAAQNAEKVGKKVAYRYLGPTVVNVVTPMAAWLIKQEAAFTVRRDTTMKIKIDENYRRFTVGVVYSF
jgi:hypothetical protein